MAYAAICVLVSPSLSAHWSHSGSPVLLMAAALGAPSSASSACQWPMRRRAERSWALFAGIRCWTEGLVGSRLELQLPGGVLPRALRWPPLLPLQGHPRPAVHVHGQGLHVPVRLRTPGHTVPATSADGPILPTLTHRPSPPSTLGTRFSPSWRTLKSGLPNTATVEVTFRTRAAKYSGGAQRCAARWTLHFRRFHGAAL